VKDSAKEPRPYSYRRKKRKRRRRREKDERRGHKEDKTKRKREEEEGKTYGVDVRRVTITSQRVGIQLKFLDGFTSRSFQVGLIRAQSNSMTGEELSIFIQRISSKQVLHRHLVQISLFPSLLVVRVPRVDIAQEVLETEFLKETQQGGSTSFGGSDRDLGRRREEEGKNSKKNEKAARE
jgi:hypothetical protein